MFIFEVIPSRSVKPAEGIPPVLSPAKKFNDFLKSIQNDPGKKDIAARIRWFGKDFLSALAKEDPSLQKLADNFDLGLLNDAQVKKANGIYANLSGDATVRDNVKKSMVDLVKQVCGKYGIQIIGKEAEIEESAENLTDQTLMMSAYLLAISSGAGINADRVMQTALTSYDVYKFVLENGAKNKEFFDVAMDKRIIKTLGRMEKMTREELSAALKCVNMRIEDLRAGYNGRFGHGFDLAGYLESVIVPRIQELLAEIDRKTGASKAIEAESAQHGQSFFVKTQIEEQRKSRMQKDREHLDEQIEGEKKKKKRQDDDYGGVS